MTLNRLHTLSLLAAITTLAPTAAHATKRKDDLQLDLSKALGTFWNAPTHPDYIDDSVTVTSDDMKQNLVCVNRSLAQTGAGVKGIWARRMFTQMVVYTIKAVSVPLKGTGIARAADVALLTLESETADDLKEKLTKKLGEAAVEKLAGKLGAKGFDKLFDYYLPPNAKPIQKQLKGEKIAGCIVDFEFTLTPPTKGKKANIRMEATTQSCRAPIKSEAAGFPNYYHLSAQGDLVPDEAATGKITYKLESKSYTLTGECGNFDDQRGGGHVPFKPIAFDKGTISVSPSFTFRGSNLAVGLFDGTEEHYFKQPKEKLVPFAYQNVSAVRVKFDKGEQLEARSTSDSSHDGKEIGMAYWFELPEGASKLVSLEVDMVVDEKTKTAKWDEKEIAKATC